MDRANILHQIWQDTSGATAIEYGLMAALVSVASITAMGALGNSLNNSFTYVGNQMAKAQTGKL